MRASARRRGDELWTPGPWHRLFWGDVRFLVAVIDAFSRRGAAVMSRKAMVVLIPLSMAVVAWMPITVRLEVAPQRRRSHSPGSNYSAHPLLHKASCRVNNYLCSTMC